MSYTLDIPDGPNNPSQDQPKMKANTNAINALINVDHVTFNNGPATGYHKVIRQTTQGSDPAVVAGVNQIYAKNYTPPGGVADTQLFIESGSGVISQMSGRQDGDEGWVWSSGILFQWGFSASGSSGTITFSDNGIPFPNNCFMVNLTFTNGGVPGGGQFATIGVSAKSETAFSFRCLGASATWPGFYWLAIGN